MTATDRHIYSLLFPSLQSIASSFQASGVCHVHEKDVQGQPGPLVCIKRLRVVLL